MQENPTNPYDLKLDATCNAEGCQLPGTLVLCVQFFMPASDAPIVRYFNFPLCEYHRWPEAAVESFLNDHWDAITEGFGLGLIPEKQRGWAFVPWWKAVEYWRKVHAARAKQEMIQ